MRTALEVSASAQTEVGPLAPSSGTRENYKDTKPSAFGDLRQFLSESEILYC